MEILRLLQAAVRAAGRENVILIFLVYLLKTTEHLQHDEIHTVLSCPEYSMSLNSYFHLICSV